MRPEFVFFALLVAGWIAIVSNAIYTIVYPFWTARKIKAGMWMAIDDDPEFVVKIIGRYGRDVKFAFLHRNFIWDGNHVLGRKIQTRSAYQMATIYKPCDPPKSFITEKP